MTNYKLKDDYLNQVTEKAAHRYSDMTVQVQINLRRASAWAEHCGCDRRAADDRNVDRLERYPVWWSI